MRNPAMAALSAMIAGIALRAESEDRKRALVAGSKKPCYPKPRQAAGFGVVNRVLNRLGAVDAARSAPQFAPLEAVKYSVGRRKRLPHKNANLCVPTWDRRFRLSTRDVSDFFTASYGR